jgi:xanthine dehydrogenase accessory factor
MRDVVAGLRTWQEQGRRFSLATVVRTWSSAPRVAGSVMAVAEDGSVIGSVSGGCVEGAVHETALQVLASGHAELCSFGVTADDAFAVGLTCGGEIEVYVEPVDETSFVELADVLDALSLGESVSVLTLLGEQTRHVVLRAEDAVRSAVPFGLPFAVPSGLPLEIAAELARPADVDRTTFGTDPTAGTFLVQHFAAPARMIIFGAVDFSASLARVGRFLGYRVTVCDARQVFATAARFPDADEVVVAWPHRYLETQVIDSGTVLCVLTHDPKFDLPLLKAALETDAGYIGVMGNRQTHADRVDRLRELGVAAVALSRLRAPIGLDLGAKTPAETAISIAAEILAARHLRSGLPLRDLDGPIHEDELSALLCDR